MCECKRDLVYIRSLCLSTVKSYSVRLWTILLDHIGGCTLIINDYIADYAGAIVIGVLFIVLVTFA